MFDILSKIQLKNFLVGILYICTTARHPTLPCSISSAHAMLCEIFGLGKFLKKRCICAQSLSPTLLFPRQKNPQLPPQQPRQRAPVPQVYPPAPFFPLRRPLSIAVFLSVIGRHVVVALGPAERGGKPDLLVRRLFVQDVGAVGREGEGEDAGLL